MKTMKTTKNTVPSAPVTLDTVILNTVNANPEGGEIEASALEKQVPYMDHNSIVKHLKESKAGRFVAGRRGHTSRFQWGNKVNAPVAKTIKSQESTQTQESKTLRFKIRLGDAEQTIELPLLVALAA